MNGIFVFVLAFLLLGAFDGQPAGVEAGDIDPWCTISCGAYWVCIAKTDGKNCEMPDGCECTDFAWDN